MKTGLKKKAPPALNEVEKSSGNVFADLGLADPEAHLARAQLAQQISDAIAEQQLTQTQAAALLGIDQPKISALIRGKLSGFSTDRLLRCLNALGRHVEILIHAKRSSRGAPGINVRAARRAS
jgi:predicted XRE-type DNA-binding protein